MIRQLAIAGALAILTLPADAFWQSRDSNYNVVVGGGGPATGIIAPYMVTMQLPNSTTTVRYGAAVGGTVEAGSVISTVATAALVPIPFDTKLSGLNVELAASQAGAEIQSFINGATGAVHCTFTTTTCSDPTDTDSIPAGSTFGFELTPNGTWAQGTTTPGQISYLLQANSGQQAALFAGRGSTAVISTLAYVGVGNASIPFASEISTSSMFSVPGQILGMYALPNASDTSSGNTHRFTICHNGTGGACTPGSGMTCTDPASFAGCCVNPTGTGTISGTQPCGSASAITIALGDTISIAVDCPGGTCASINPGIALIWQPTTSGQVPLFEMMSTSNSTTTYMGMSDFATAGSSATQVNYQLAPLLPTTMTFSHYLMCSGAPGAGITRTATMQFATTPATPPGTSAGPTVTFGPGTPCPGSQPAVWTGGAIDTTHTFAASTGYSLDTMLAASGGVSGPLRVSMAVTIP